MGLTAFRARRLPAERIAFHLRRIPALRSRLVERFAADLRELHDVLEQTDLRGHYWMWGGLVLGWARDGAILPHDSRDADFAVADGDFHRLVQAVPAIVRAGFRCDRRFVNHRGLVTELTFVRHGAAFDFFRMFADSGGLRYFAYGADKNGLVELEKSLVDQPRVPFSFLGRTWLKHEDHELELRTVYGRWEIPDPAWDYLNGPNIEAHRTWQYPAIDWRGEVADMTSDSWLGTRNA